MTFSSFPQFHPATFFFDFVSTQPFYSLLLVPFSWHLGTWEAWVCICLHNKQHTHQPAFNSLKSGAVCGTIVGKIKRNLNEATGAELPGRGCRLSINRWWWTRGVCACVCVCPRCVGTHLLLWMNFSPNQTGPNGSWTSACCDVILTRLSPAVKTLHLPRHTHLHLHTHTLTHTDWSINSKPR